MQDPLASIVIVAWKGAPHLAKCLRSLTAARAAVPFEVVLVLNEPTQKLVSYVERETVGLVRVATRVNVGYGGAVNLGVQRARGEFIVLLNDDTEVKVGWLDALVDCARRREEAAAIGSTTLFLDGSIQEAGNVIWSDGTTVKVGRGLPPSNTEYDFERRVDFCSGTSLLVRRKVWLELGGMDERYFPAYYEDTDLCLRILESGRQIWYQPRSYVEHLESASTESFYRQFLLNRNRARFVERWRKELCRRVDRQTEGKDPLDLAVWRAMGSPVRVLVLGDDEASATALLRRLQHLEGCFFTLGAREITSRSSLSPQGVRALRYRTTNELRHQLDRPQHRYDLVIDYSRDHVAKRVLDLLDGFPIYRCNDATRELSFSNARGASLSEELGELLEGLQHALIERRGD